MESELGQETLAILQEVMGEHVQDFYDTCGEKTSSIVRSPFIDDKSEVEVKFEPDEEPQRKKHHVAIQLLMKKRCNIMLKPAETSSIY